MSKWLDDRSVVGPISVWLMTWAKECPNITHLGGCGRFQSGERFLANPPCRFTAASVFMQRVFLV